MDAAQKVLQKTKQLADKLARYETLHTEWEDLKTLVELGNEMEDLSVLGEIKTGTDALVSKLEELRLETLLSGP